VAWFKVVSQHLPGGIEENYLRQGTLSSTCIVLFCTRYLSCILTTGTADMFFNNCV